MTAPSAASKLSARLAFTNCVNAELSKLSESGRAGALAGIPLAIKDLFDSRNVLGQQLHGCKPFLVPLPLQHLGSSSLDVRIVCLRRTLPFAHLTDDLLPQDEGYVYVRALSSDKPLLAFLLLTQVTP